MLVIPAIDLKEGRVVRLEQGRMDREKTYGDDPGAMGKHWSGLGAELIHVVDLNGAFAGKRINEAAVLSIVKNSSAPIELGGGIRDLEGIRFYLDAGVNRVILGTVAHKNPELVAEAARLFPGRIVVGIDARDGKVAVEGWDKTTRADAIELAKRYDAIPGLAAIIYTDIAKDGMLSGPSVESTVALARAIKLPVIASGGVANLGHIRALLPFEKDGIAGVITGRAIYEGTLDLKAAITLAKGGSA